MNMKSIFTLSLFSLLVIVGYAQSLPQVSISQVLVDENDYSNLEVRYNLTADASDSVEIMVLHSIDGGLSFEAPSSLSGDFGKPVAEGNRTLTYQAAATATALEEIQVKIVALSRFKPNIQDLVDEVDKLKLENLVTTLEGTRNYAANPTRMDSIKDFLEAEMAQYGSVNRLNFNFSGNEGQNMISNHTGMINPSSVVINGAHFDGVINSPGADDNASAVAGVIEAMRILSDYQFKNTIRFLLFDLEELGLRGSIDYVSNDLDLSENLRGAIINEMIGYVDSTANSQQFPAGFNLLFPEAFNEVASDSFRGNFITNVGNSNSAPLMAYYGEAAAEYVPELRIIDVEAPGNSQTVPDLRRSDHAPFWDADKQALMITDGANFRNPNYHQPTDVSSTLDFNFMKTVVKANVATLAVLAEPISASSDESGYTALLNVETLDARSNDCVRVLNNPIDGVGQQQLTLSHCGDLQFSSLQITDLSGRQIEIDEVKTINNERISIQFNAEASGIYIVSGMNGDRAFAKQFIVD